MINTENSIKRSNTKLQNIRSKFSKSKRRCMSRGQETAHLETHEEYTAELVEKIDENNRGKNI